VYLIIIHIEQDQKIELSRCSFQKVIKNLLFHLKAVKTGTQKAQVGAGAETFRKSEPEPELEPNQIVSAPQHFLHIRYFTKYPFPKSH
jgi:hypothetical protein